MSARKERPAYKSNKQLVQCQRCGKWMTLQGLNGHVRFFHERDWEPERAMAVLLARGDLYADYLILRGIAKPGPLSSEERKALLLGYELYARRTPGSPEGTAGGADRRHPAHRMDQPSHGRSNGASRRAKTLGRCPMCQREMSPTGLTGHIRFRHPDFYIIDKALTHLVEAGDRFAQWIVLNRIHIDVPIADGLLRRYRKALGK